jgi:hypothetical protein
MIIMITTVMKLFFFLFFPFFVGDIVVEMIMMNHDDYVSYYDIVHVVKSCLD